MSREFLPIEDNNSDYDKVYLKDGLPHCREHGAMIKVSPYFWRCIRTKGALDCRAGCREIRNESRENTQKDQQADEKLQEEHRDAKKAMCAKHKSEDADRIQHADQGRGRADKEMSVPEAAAHRSKC